MEKQAQEFCKRLDIKYNSGILPFYKKGLELKSKLGTAICDEKRLIRLNNEYHFFRKWFDDILKAASIIKEDDDLLLYNYILYCIIKDEASVSIFPPPNKGVIETDFSPMFALLWFLEDMIARMEKIGLSWQVISDTLQGFEAEINDYYNMFGRSGMRRYVSWFLLFIRGKIIRVGRLNFEFTSLQQKIRVYQKEDDIKILIDGQYMHKKGMVFGSKGQDDEESKFFADIVEEAGRVSGYTVDEYGECIPEKVTLEGYTEILRKGDNVLSVHIPADEPFTPQLCEESFKEAKKIMADCYPETNIKAFYGCSWMFEKRLKELMGRETNITRFADLFYIFPVQSAAEAVQSYLFHKSGQIKCEELPEDNSMQRAVKKYLCEGNYFYEKGGIRMI